MSRKRSCILLTLLHLGIKNIRLGPTLPAFISPNVLNYLVENFGIAPIHNAGGRLEAASEIAVLYESYKNGCTAPEQIKGFLCSAGVKYL